MVATTSYIQSIDFQDFKSNSSALISKLKTELDTTGYALLKNYDIDFNNLEITKEYSSYPEDYFGLLTLSKAKCGGGLSYILTLADIMAELEETEEGKEVIRVFKTTKYPFIVPNVFKRGNEDKPEFVFGEILKNNEIRFRVDTIQKAINYNSDFCTEKQIWAFNYFVDYVRKTEKTKKFYLENHDLVLINNKTTLHGRSSFTDYDRHLLRIRMNKFSKV